MHIYIYIYIYIMRCIICIYAYIHHRETCSNVRVIKPMPMQSYNDVRVIKPITMMRVIKPMQSYNSPSYIKAYNTTHTNKYSHKHQEETCGKVVK